MKFLTWPLFSVFLICFYSNLHAQVTSPPITGKVLTQNHLPATGSTIILLKYRDSSIVNSTVAGENGLFQFAGVPPDNYLLLVTKVGYNKLYTGPYQVTAGQTCIVPDMVLQPATKELNEVTIVSNKPYVEVKPGMVVLNVQNSISAAGNSVYDILRQSPGVRVDNNVISIIGRQNALITIDSKPTNLSGDDLVSLLRGMQSNTIDHIELITGGSAKYDASAGGIVNIVLKKGNNLGANATVTASAGYGKYYKGNASIIFNDRTESSTFLGTIAIRKIKRFTT
jgi:iron complex outermembrane receptor protein